MARSSSARFSRSAWRSAWSSVRRTRASYAVSPWMSRVSRAATPPRTPAGPSCSPDVEEAWRRASRHRAPMHEGSARMGADGAAGGSSPADPVELLRSRRYVAILVMGAVVGVPVAVVAYFFLKVVGELQNYVFTTLPGDLGFDAEPAWWPIPMVALGGLLVALAISRLPGTGGHEPAEGFKTGETQPVALAGIVAASLATLSFGAVLGPEAPLIAIGGGLGILAVNLTRRDV